MVSRVELSAVLLNNQYDVINACCLLATVADGTIEIAVRLNLGMCQRNGTNSNLGHLNGFTTFSLC